MAYVSPSWDSADVGGQVAEVHIRTDANNLVTTAASTTTPEQKETIHMNRTLRKEALFGQMADSAHIRSKFCLGDCPTKASAKSGELGRAVDTGSLRKVDGHPDDRHLIKHQAFLVSWISTHLSSHPSDRVFLEHSCKESVVSRRVSG